MLVTDEEHLERQRLGAIWANRSISYLFSRGWGYRSAEIFLLCGSLLSRPSARMSELTNSGGRPVPQYGRFADHNKESFMYFSGHLTHPKYTGQVIELTDWVPLSIPCIIKCLFGDTFK